MGKSASVAPIDSATVRRRSLGAKLLTGDAGMGLNCLCCPFVSAFWSTRIYLIPCMLIYTWRFLSGPFYWVARKICCACCSRYTDKKFKADASSIGEGKWKKDDIKWERASVYYASLLTEEQMKAGVRVKLFEAGIEPKDVAQGQVGNCWLIAALACVAEHPGLVRKAFVTKTANPRGKYVMRLWDWSLRRWATISVDENIPLKAANGKPIFAQPNGHELWVSMIEKAFAKFVGSYAALDGGQTAWALNALTGDPVFKLKKEGGDEGAEGAKWKRLDMKVEAGAENKRECSFWGTDEEFDNTTVFFMMRAYAKRQALLGASFGGYKPEGSKEEGDGEKGEGDGKKGLNGEDMGPQGLVAGHAYSILDAMSFKDKSQPGGRLKLIRLRNPWGKYEVRGPHPSRSPLHRPCTSPASPLHLPCSGPGRGPTARRSGRRTRR